MWPTSLFNSRKRLVHKCWPNRSIFPCSDCHRKFLHFSSRNKTYQFRILPFGLSLAPCVFKRCMKATLSPLCSDEGPIWARYTAAAGPHSQFGSLSDQSKEYSVSYTVHHVHRDDNQFGHNACLAVSISDNRYPKPPCPVFIWEHPSSSGGPPCACTFGQHVNVPQSESPGGHKVGELVAAYSQYPHLVISTVCIIEGCLFTRGSQSDCRSSVQELDTSKRVEAPPGCSAGPLAGVRYGRSRSICFGKHNFLPIVVCPDGSVQSIGTGCTVTRLVRLSSVCFSSDSSVVGDTSQDYSGLTQGTCDSAKVAVQTTVSLAPNLVGGQTKAASFQEGYAILVGQSYLASRSSPSTVMGLASGANAETLSFTLLLMWGLLLHKAFIPINEVFLFVVQDTLFWPCTMHSFCSFEHPERSFRQRQISLHDKGLCGSHFCTSFTCRKFFSGLPQPSLQFFKGARRLNPAHFNSVIPLFLQCGSYLWCWSLFGNLLLRTQILGGSPQR